MKAQVTTVGKRLGQTLGSGWYRMTPAILRFVESDRDMLLITYWPTTLYARKAGRNLGNKCTAEPSLS